MKSYQALPAFATIALAVEPYHGIAYGGNNRGVLNYTYANLPYRNDTGSLLYQAFNWTYEGPAADNGYWTVRYNTADNWLPGNLSVSSMPVRVRSFLLDYTLLLSVGPYCSFRCL